MISSTNIGENYLKISKWNKKFQEVLDYLPSIENYLINYDSRIINCHYWALGDRYPDILIVTKNNIVMDGEFVPQNYRTVKEKFPAFFDLLDELQLEHYIGRTKVSDWGIHRHIYNQQSKWNICFFEENNKDAIVSFYKIDDNNIRKEFKDVFFDSVEFNQPKHLELIEAVKVNDGEVYCFLPEQWHSHVSSMDTKNLTTFLLHFKNAETRNDLLELSKVLCD